MGVFLVWGGEIANYFGSNSAKAHDYASDLATLLSNNTNVWYSISGEYDGINNFDYQHISPPQFGMLDGLADGLGPPDSSILRSIHPGAPWTSVLQFAPGGGCGGTSGINCHPDLPDPVHWLKFHMLQSAHKSVRGPLGSTFYKQTDELIDQGYWLSNPTPIFDAEPFYENIVDGAWHIDPGGPNNPRCTASHVRFKAYEAVFAGACGHTYGHENTAYMWSQGTPANQSRPWTQAIYWKDALDDVAGAHGEGATQLRYLKDLVECRSANRIQDQGIIGETPYPSISPSDYEAAYGGLKHKRATRNSAGTWVLVYLPQGATEYPNPPESLYREVTVNADNLASYADDWGPAKWFNPETGLCNPSPAELVSHVGHNWTYRTPGFRTGHENDPVRDYVLVWQSPTFDACDP